MHFKNVVVILFFLQYPGFGPIPAPPVQSALVEGHDEHSPGFVILAVENPEPFGHFTHLPADVKASPTPHSLRLITIPVFKSVL